MVGLFKIYSTVKINKTEFIDGIIIENNMDSKFDKLGNVISNIFLVNGIKNIKYKNYLYNNNEQKKIILSISGKAYKENKQKFENIVNGINNIINKCDIDNKLISVAVSDKYLSTVFPPLNTIEFSDKFMKEHAIDENQIINLIDVKSGVIKVCCAKYNKKLNSNFIALNPLNREAFINIKDTFIQKKSNIEFNNVSVQNVNYILNGFITISQDNRKWIEKHGGSQFELINEITGASIDIGVDKIKYSKLNKNTIRLNSFQRLVLECELPQKISNYYYQKYKIKLEKK